MQSEAYLDIVWRQFKKHRAAYWSLWSLVPLFLLAIFAPLIASDKPLIFHTLDVTTERSTTLYPWFRALFNQKDLVDFVFNMALVGFFPWLCIAIITNLVCKKRGTAGRHRIGIVFVEFFAITVFLIVFFSLPGFDGESRYAFRPNNKYYTRTFTVEEFDSKGKSHGIYALIRFGPREQDLDSIYKGPSFFPKDETEWKDSNDHWPHLLGTDDLGSDVLVRMIYGTRVSMTVGFLAVSIYLSIGIVVGAFAGYFGGKIDILISRIIEVMLLFPSFFLILTLIWMIGPSIYIIMVVIGLTGWPTIARLIRGEVLKQRAIDYTAAAQALGASHTRVIFRHILPNALGPALVAAPFGIASAIITEAGLSLLGFGVQPPAPTWGVLLELAFHNYSYWWLIVVPSVAIFFVVTVFNLIGGGLRDAMDPKLRQ